MIYDDFKSVRRILRDHSFDSISIQLARKLREQEVAGVQSWMKYAPWHLALLLKWAIIHSEEKYPTKSLQPLKFEHMCRITHNMWSDLRSEFLGKGIRNGAEKFFRITSHHQFAFQAGFSKWTIPRQLILFGSKGSENFNDYFRQVSRLSIQEFLEYLLCVWGWLSTNNIKPLFPASQFFSGFIGKETETRAFVEYFGLNRDQVRERITSGYVIRDISLEIVESSPMYRYPAIAIGKNLLMVSSRMFETYLEMHLYECAKGSNDPSIRSWLSDSIEEYVGRTLATTSLKLLPESELKRRFPERKVTDYLVVNDDCILIVEVKSVELSPIARVRPTREIMEKDLRAGVSRAYIQGYSLLEQLLTDNELNRLIGSVPVYLMVVTYKDLFLGTGVDCWDEFAEEAVRKAVPRTEELLNLLPPQNTIVGTIRELDQIAGYGKTDRSSLASFFAKMSSENKEPKTRRWMLQQHINEFSKDNQLEEPQPFDAALVECKNRIRPCLANT